MQAFLFALLHVDPAALVETGGYLGIGLVVFAESGILLGIFLPGDSLLFVAGLLAAAGLLNPFALGAVAVAAAILGDGVGYWIGAKAGASLFSRPDSRFFKQSYVDRTQRFYAKYGARAIVLARFVPIVRTLAPVLAGVGAMRYARFALYNAVGGFLWCAGMLALGYTLGAVLPDSEKYILPLSLVVIVISFIPVAVELIRERAR